MPNDGSYKNLTITKLKKWNEQFPIKNGPQLTLGQHTKQENNAVRKQVDKLIKEVSKSTPDVESVLNLIEETYKIIESLTTIQKRQQIGAQKYHTAKLKEFIKYLKGEFSTTCLDRNPELANQKYEIRSDAKANAAIAAYFKKKNTATIEQDSYTKILQIMPMERGINPELIEDVTLQTQDIVEANIISASQEVSLLNEDKADFIPQNSF